MNVGTSKRRCSVRSGLRLLTASRSIDNALTRPWTVMKDYRRLSTVIWMKDKLPRG
jgi:hypothetical protein